MRGCDQLRRERALRESMPLGPLPDVRQGSDNASPPSGSPIWYGMVDGICAKARSRFRSPALPPALSADCGEDPLRSTGSGERLPATRELAGLLGLNRTTVSAAYEMLEAEGLISGQVGRGSFVTGAPMAAGGVDWSALLERSDMPPSVPPAGGPGRHQLRDVAAFARAVSAGRVSRQLRGGAGARGPGGHSATGLAQRLRTAAPLPDGRGAAAAARRVRETIC